MRMAKVSGAQVEAIRSAVRSITAYQVISVDLIGFVGSYFLKGGCHTSIILRKRNQACSIAHIAAASPVRCQQHWFQPTLWAKHCEWLWAEFLLIGGDHGLNIESRDFFLFRRSECFLEKATRDMIPCRMHLLFQPPSAKRLQRAEVEVARTRHPGNVGTPLDQR